MYSAIWSKAATSHVREILEYMRTENPPVARRLANAFALFTDTVFGLAYIRTKFSILSMNRKNRYLSLLSGTASGKIHIYPEHEEYC